MSTDPYVPGVGTDAATVEHIALDLDVRLAANRVSGTAVLRVRLTKQSRRIELDLYRLRVSRVDAVVDGRAVASSFTQPGRCLLYTSPRPRDYGESRMPSSA